MPAQTVATAAIWLLSVSNNIGDGIFLAKAYVKETIVDV